MTSFTKEEIEKREEEKQDIATQADNAPFFEGDFDANDMEVPWLTVVAGNSELAQEHGAGSLVLGGEWKLSDGKTPIEVVVLTGRKFYQEKGEDVEFPRRFDDKQELIKAGLTLQYPATATPVGAFTVLIKNPDPKLFGPVFPFQHKEDSYALAKWNIKNKSYEAATTIFTDGNSTHKDNPLKARWLVTSKLKPAGKYKVNIPSLTLAEDNDEDFLQFANKMRSFL